MQQDRDISTHLKRNLEEMPILSTVAVQLMALHSTDANYSEDVLRLIESEPNFSARVLASANSAASSPVSPITTLPAAVARIGSVGAANIVVALGVLELLTPRDAEEKDLWRHALRSALAMRALLARSNPFGLRPDEAYAAALVHDFGRFVMFRHAPQEARLDSEGDWDQPKRLVDHERAVCGIDHAELGAFACTNWGIPELIAEVIATHHDPLPRQPSTLAQHIAGILRFADLAMFPTNAPWISERPTRVPDTSADNSATDHRDRLKIDVAIVERQLVPRLPKQMRIGAWALADVIRMVTEEAEFIGRALGLEDDS